MMSFVVALVMRIGSWEVAGRSERVGNTTPEDDELPSELG